MNFYDLNHKNYKITIQKLIHNINLDIFMTIKSLKKRIKKLNAYGCKHLNTKHKKALPGGRIPRQG